MKQGFKVEEARQLPDWNDISALDNTRGQRKLPQKTIQAGKLKWSLLNFSNHENLILSERFRA